MRNDPNVGRIDTARRSSESPASATGAPYMGMVGNVSGRVSRDRRDKGVCGLDCDRRRIR